MSNFLVAGLINIETTLRVDGFPLAYEPVRYPFYGVQSTVSGVGYNVASALARLGHGVRLLSMVGADMLGGAARAAVTASVGDTAGVVETLRETPQSVILYDPEGRRQIHVDLKEIQKTEYPVDHFEQAIEGCDVAVLCNINFSRPFLARARALGIPVATDVHALGNLDDEYNRDYLEAADILFMSHERIPCPIPEWVSHLKERTPARVIVIGCGEHGAALHTREDDRLSFFPAVSTRPIVNTIGAGDALFSAFLHGAASGLAPDDALRRAMLFASWKIGEKGAAAGFLTAAELDALSRGRAS